MQRKSITFRLGLVLAVSILPFIANLGVQLLQISLFELIAPAKIIQGYPLLKWVVLVGYQLLIVFPIIMLITAIYFFPIYRYAIKPDSCALERVQRKLLNAPLMSAAISLLGWVVAGGFQIKHYLNVHNGIPDYFLLGYDLFVNKFMPGSLAFVIIYFCLDYLNRIYFIPALFDNTRVADILPRWRMNLYLRVMIFTYGMTIYPGLLLFLIIFRLNNSGANVVGYDITGKLIGVVVVMELLAFILCFILFRSVLFPVRKSVAATQRIRRGKYDIKLEINSADEVGMLSESLNLMAAEIEELRCDLETKVQERTTELNSALEQINKDLELARGIQARSLPGSVRAMSTQTRHQLDFQYRYMPQAGVGGDVLDIYETSESLRIFLADAMGHGVQASLFTMAIRGEYDELKTRHGDPGQLLTELNQRFMSKFGHMSIYFPALVLDVDLSHNTLRYASGGLVEQLLDAEQSIWLKHTGPIIGLRPDYPFTSLEQSFAPGDSLLLYTDGLTEVQNSDRVMFGDFKLLETWQESQGKELSMRLNHLMDVCQNFNAAQELPDDATIVAIERMQVFRDPEEAFEHKSKDKTGVLPHKTAGLN